MSIKFLKYETKQNEVNMKVLWTFQLR